jgi:hypothetical protein
MTNRTAARVYLYLGFALYLYIAVWYVIDSYQGAMARIESQYGGQGYLPAWAKKP